MTRNLKAATALPILIGIVFAASGTLTGVLLGIGLWILALGIYLAGSILAELRAIREALVTLAYHTRIPSSRGEHAA